MLIRRIFFSFVILLIGFQAVKAQIIPIDTVFKQSKFNAIIATESALYAGSLSGLWFAWYNDYSSSNFHAFNDNAEWLQIDKIGHSMTSYYFGKIGYDFMRAGGLKKSQSLIYGGGIGFVYLSTVEIMDGFSTGWGFSWGDMAANAFGTALFVSQQWAFDKQIISMKFGYHPTSYAQFRPNILGENHLQRLIKDYNGQTYWLSANISSFLHDDAKFPKWINLAVGYGADGLLGGFSNPFGSQYPVFERNRQFYLSLDWDLTQIPTENKWLKSLFHIFNFVKLPFPALELNDGVLKFHPLYF